MSQKIITHTLNETTAGIFRDLMRLTSAIRQPGDVEKLRGLYKSMSETIDNSVTDSFTGVDSIVHTLLTAKALCEGINPDRNMLLAILLIKPVECGVIIVEQVAKDWGHDVAALISGLVKVSGLYGMHAAATDPDNFRKLLLTLAEDVRVVIIMIVERLMLMRAINHHPDHERVIQVASEANYLYAPLAHRLGLYAIKGELEDLSLKYSNREIFTRIARRLNETKAKRDAYIDAFIGPVKAKLEKEGLNFEIKGRTKSIYSIWNKMKKQNIDLDHIYDLSAIRIIIDTPLSRKRSDCWLAYSIVTDMYQPNPARLKDWLSIPKSNGYESLHITVMGPEGKWVEVQIRTRRMDEIAEKGVAAHWKYKGGRSEGNLDTWMNRVRELLEQSSEASGDMMKNMKLDPYCKEVFVFTPRGDLFKFPEGATLLDFAFNIHSRLGCTCTGGRVNGRTRKLNYRLKSGDTVEVFSQANQQPKADWLSFVVTSKARNKIRQSLNEQASRQAELGRELLQRRLKNRKLEVSEAVLMKVIKRLGYKTVSDFYSAISIEELDINRVVSEIEAVEQMLSGENGVARSAEEFTLQNHDEEQESNSDVLVIGPDNIKGLNYRFARCCNPIYGDKVFGFISSEGAVKIHRLDCPNAMSLRERYPYRIIAVKWSGKVGAQFGATLKVVGHDDIGIVTNITSIINKEKDSTLRSISIDSHDGIFQGYLVVGVPTINTLDSLIKKIKTVKGVKNVERSN